MLVDEQANPHASCITAAPRELGSLRDKIWMAPDYDEPDKELVDLMENGPIFPDEADRL